MGTKRLLFILILGFAEILQAYGDGFGTISRTNSRIKEGAKAMKSKDFQTAALRYEEALKEYPNLPAQVRMNLAHSYYNLNKNSNAQKNYLIALSQLNTPKLKSVACQQIGNIYSREKNYKSALEWYQKSLLHLPENKSARLNYELAYKLNKKKEEEEKKQNPKKNQSKQSQNNQQQQKPEQQKENQKNQQQQDQQNQGNTGKDKKDSQNEKGSEKKDSGAGPKKGDKQGQTQTEQNENKSDSKQEGGKQETPDENGKDSKEKTKDSNMEDPEAYRMDRKKLQEAGLSEEQAKNMLQAMRQNEVKYLQQKRFKSKSAGNNKSGPRW